MAKKRKAKPISTEQPTTTAPALPNLVRVVGRERTAHQILRSALRATNEFAMVEFMAQPIPPTAMEPDAAATPSDDADYAQIDPLLTVQPAPILSETPPHGSGYSGFTPVQRHHFVQWVSHPEVMAPPAFRRLYIAQLEVSLFDTMAKSVAAHEELLHLSDAPTWQKEEALWRALLLSFWLKQHGHAFSAWLSTSPTLPVPLTGLAFGLLAKMGQALTIEQLPFLAHQWRIPTLPDVAVLRLRMAFLQSTIDAEPLAHALAALDPATTIAKPWRCTHRDLRIALPQPDVRSTLEPYLRELATLSDTVPVATMVDEEDDADQMADDDDARSSSGGGSSPSSKPKWQLVLEFGDSRSEFFEHAIAHAKMEPGYIQIMDENRRMIHRIHFEKRELRRFWFLWEYVQNWSSTAVFVNGKELQKLEIYPYSPALR